MEVGCSRSKAVTCYGSDLLSVRGAAPLPHLRQLSMVKYLMSPLLPQHYALGGVHHRLDLAPTVSVIFAEFFKFQELVAPGTCMT